MRNLVGGRWRVTGGGWRSWKVTAWKGEKGGRRAGQAGEGLGIGGRCEAGASQPEVGEASDTPSP